jgi:hypothetical protein
MTGDVWIEIQDYEGMCCTMHYEIAGIMLRLCRHAAKDTTVRLRINT